MTLSHQRTGQRLFEGLEQSYVHHISIAYEILDCVISELDRRFSKKPCKIFIYLFYLYIYPPEPQESDGGTNT